MGQAGSTCAEGALLETCADAGLVYTREIGDGDVSRVPGVPACVLVPWGSADDCARVLRPARTRKFGYKLIKGVSLTTSSMSQFVTIRRNKNIMLYFGCEILKNDLHNKSRL